MSKNLFLALSFFAGMLIFMPGSYYFVKLGIHSKYIKVNLGLEDGKLRTCSEKPNCVSSSANPEDTEHFVSGLTISSFPKSELLAYAKEQNWKLQKEENNYFYFTVTSKVFNFVDDVEVNYDQENNHLFFRSSSRIGYSDLGANRKRMNALKEFLSHRFEANS